MNKIVGVDYNEGPPVPIPNTEVKPVSYTHLAEDLTGLNYIPKLGMQ